MSNKTETRYFVFGKRAAERTGEYRSVKNCAVREDAREFKRTKVDGTVFGIYDRQTETVVR
jgi:hypothetical protein